MGLNIKTREGLPLGCTILRLWNMRRLKVNLLNLTDIDLVHRVCEHLFCLGRELMREVPDDYNTYHANVQHFVSNF